MKCEYCEIYRKGPFVIAESCAILNGKLVSKATGETLKTRIHHTVKPNPCKNGGVGCPLYRIKEGERVNERCTAEQ